VQGREGGGPGEARGQDQPDRTFWAPVIDDGREVEPLPRVDLDPAYLAPFVAIAKRRGCVLETYHQHHRRPVHIQIGPAYRGAAIPASYADGPDHRQNGLQPDADVYDPGLPPPPPPKPKAGEEVEPVELEDDDPLSAENIVGTVRDMQVDLAREHGLIKDDDRDGDAE
jgi:hypothetical protein